MSVITLLYIPTLSLAFGIHGGELITGINRQARNIFCAFPFAIFAYFTWDYPEAIAAFTMAYIGANMGFDNHPLWLKGLITMFPFGAALLPLAYWIGNKTPWKNVTSEYLSGFLYGLTLTILSLIINH